MCSAHPVRRFQRLLTGVGLSTTPTSGGAGWHRAGGGAYLTPRLPAPAMNTTAFPRVDPARITPEHFQLLSDARLRAIAEAQDPTDRPSATSGTSAMWRRLARHELQRRHPAETAH